MTRTRSCQASGESRRSSTRRPSTGVGHYEHGAGAKVSGARFGFIEGDAARLSLALYRLALDRLVEGGLHAGAPPVLVREEAMYGTGFFPSEKSTYYAVPRDGLYLVGTSEVPLIAMHMGEILDSCRCATARSRRASGARPGRRARTRAGCSACTSSRRWRWSLHRAGRSWDEHERLLALEEALVQEVGLPYRVVNSAAGDLGDRRGEAVRHRGLVPVPGALPGDHVVLEHDGLPGAAPRDPLPRGEKRPRDAAHAERHRRRPTAGRSPSSRTSGGEVPDVLQQLRRAGARQQYSALEPAHAVHRGGVPERSNGAVLKTATGASPVGSNPTPAA